MKNTKAGEYDENELLLDQATLKARPRLLHGKQTSHAVELSSPKWEETKTETSDGEALHKRLAAQKNCPNFSIPMN